MVLMLVLIVQHTKDGDDVENADADCCTDVATAFAGGSIMKWGGITGKTRLVPNEGHLSAVTYQDNILYLPISPQSGT